MKNNKGITLVALVITIIILLILAGISIATLTGSGLFENAKLAEQESKNAQELEDATLKDYENKISEYVSSDRANTESVEVIGTGDGNLSKSIKEFKKLGFLIDDGYYLYYREFPVDALLSYERRFLLTTYGAEHYIVIEDIVDETHLQFAASSGTSLLKIYGVK